jgi:hypothetical protein
MSHKSYTWGLRAALAVAALVQLTHPGTARADPIALAPGMMIRNERGYCSAGFFGRNDAGQDLLVTAGHCSSHLGEQFADEAWDPIGTVVARSDDDADIPRFGYTVIRLNASTPIQRQGFSGTARARPGETVTILGAGSGGERGTILRVVTDPTDPAGSEIDGTAEPWGGDSGAPWVDPDLLLLGVTIGKHSAADGAFEYAIGEPVPELVQLIRTETGSWGAGFTIDPG